jgi:chitodextrinase
LVIVTENEDDLVVYYGLSTSAVVQELVTGANYWFKVKATNAVGDGEWSAMSTFLIVDAPSPPFNV